MPGGRNTHPGNPPPLGLVCVIEKRAWVSEHLGGKLRGQMLYGKAMVAVGAEYLRRLVHERWLRHGWWHLEASHVVIHGGQSVGGLVESEASLLGSSGLSQIASTGTFLSGERSVVVVVVVTVRPTVRRGLVLMVMLVLGTIAVVIDSR